MAKGKKSGKPTIDEEKLSYFFLITLTSKGRIEKASIIRKDQDGVTDLVNSLDGRCELFSIPGPYDFISKVEGITAFGAIQVQQKIEAAGLAKAQIAPAVRILK